MLLRASCIWAVSFFLATGAFWATLIAATAFAALSTFTTLGRRACCIGRYGWGGFTPFTGFVAAALCTLTAFATSTSAATATALATLATLCACRAVLRFTTGTFRRA